ncbi:MAG: YraN family protein [Marivibrio sp.]|uniref:YraN family protein n=1 Tax=Marivibrio sp. TaxID=2039719 RepID=UPI0032ECF03C
MARDPATRRRAEGRGRKAEDWAALWLRLKGYSILARRARTPVGEIDLIVRRGRLIAAVEVKARADLGEAAASVTERQRRRIAQGFDYWLALKPELSAFDRRFDVILVAPGKRPRHLPDAWRL